MCDLFIKTKISLKIVGLHMKKKPCKWLIWLWRGATKFLLEMLQNNLNINNSLMTRTFIKRENSEQNMFFRFFNFFFVNVSDLFDREDKSIIDMKIILKHFQKNLINKRLCDYI